MAFEVKMPQLGLTMEEGTVTKWVKQEGDTVKAGDVILEITTDKLTSEVESEHDGVLLKIVAQEGEDIPVKGLLAYIGEAGEQVGDAPAAKAEAPAAEAAAPVPAAAPAAPVASVAGGRIRISPLAKKTAAKLGVDYTTVAGSGPLGRIVQKDILAAAEQKARSTYEYLIDLTDDPDVLAPLRFLREREIVHFQRFGEALDYARDYLKQQHYFFMQKNGCNS